MIEQQIEGFLLSPQQERLWRVRGEGHADAFRTRFRIRIEGPLDRAALRDALRLLVERHSVLRTRPQTVAGMAAPLQVIDEDARPPVAEYDLTAFGDAERERELERLFEGRQEPSGGANEAATPMRAALCAVSADEHALLVSLPALFADNGTARVFASELALCYAARVSGLEPPDEPPQYVQFAGWQNELLSGEAGEAGQDFWRRQEILPLAAPALPFAVKGAEARGARAEASEARREDGEAFDALAARYETTPALVLLACFKVLLWRFTGQSPVTVGTAVDGRKYAELDSMPGLLDKHVPVRSHLTGGESFGKFLTRLTADLSDACEWQEGFAFEPSGDDAPPLFPVGFEHADLSETFSAGAVGFSVSGLKSFTEPCGLRLVCRRTRASLLWQFESDPEAYRAEDIESFARCYGELLRSVLGDPEATLERLGIVDEETRRRLVVEFNETAREFGGEACVHRLFERQAALTPEAVAVRAGERRLTYAELNGRANRLAHYLRARGVGPESVVGVFCGHSADLLVSILGVLKAGGAYLPLDPSNPSQRLAYILADAGVSLVLTQTALAASLPAGVAEAFAIDSSRAEFEGSPAGDLAGGASGDNLAYVIYTSGSTGKPKGTLITHDGLANYLQWAASAYGVGRGAGAPLHSSVAFDLTVTSIFTPLITGRTVVVARDSTSQNLDALADVLREQGDFSLVKVTPAHARLLGQQLPKETLAGRARVLILGGEALVAQDVAFWREHSPETVVVNEYGPTETVVGCCVYELRPGAAAEGLIPIGRPVANMALYVLDAHMQPAPVGVAGELYIGGEGLARGYLKRPGLTAERFVPHPFSPTPGARLYRTGDVARHLPDGNLEYLGRSDQQVKVRGYRVELGEIEAVLSEHPGVREAAVVVREDRPGDVRLVAYVAGRGRAAGAPHGGELYRLPNGLEVAHLNKSETDWLYKEIFEDEVYLKHGVTLRDGDCVFDVGANIGAFTLFVHHRCRPARVYSFEPSPVSFEALSANAALYGLDARLFQCGLSDAERDAAFTFYPKMSLYSGFYASDTDEQVTRAYLNNCDEGLRQYADELLDGRFEGETYVCRLRTLSAVIAEEGVERIDLLKLDIERSELDVLNGIAEADWQKIKQLVVEAHDLGDRLERIVGLLERHGFTVVVEQERLLESSELYNIYAVHPSRDAAAPQGAQGAAAWAGGEAGLLSRRGTLTAGELREYAGGQLPEYMVPSAFVILDSLPLTANGKVDRKALPAPGKYADENADQFVAPRTPVEEVVAGIFAEVLKLERVGADDNFFRLGGHSLAAAQVVSHVREAFQLALPLRVLFERPTVEGASEWIESQQKKGQGLLAPPILRVGRERELPLSFAQQRLWFLDQLEPGSTSYNIPFTLRLSGPLDVDALSRSLAEVTRRHESLRTTFERAPDGLPRQLIHPPSDFPLPLTDLSGLAAEEREQQARLAAAEEAARPFDLSAGPLVRARLLKLSDAEHVLAFVMHHIVSDGWSMGVLVREVSALYEALAAGGPSPLEELEVQYADYAVWQRGWLQGEVLDRQLDFWKKQLAKPLPELALSTSKKRPAAEASRSRTLSFGLPEELSSALKALAQRERATTFMALLAAFKTLLYRHTGQEDVLVGTVVANRDRKEVEGLIGFFINVLVLRTDLSGSPTFRELLARVRKTSTDAYTHQDLPFDMLVAELQLARDMGSVPVVQAVLNYIPRTDVALELPGLRLSVMPTDYEPVQFDLVLNVRERADGFAVGWTYHAGLFEETAVRLMHEHFLNLLGGAVASPETRLADLPMLTEEETEQRARREREIEEANVRSLSRVSRRPVRIAGGQGEPRQSKEHTP